MMQETTGIDNIEAALKALLNFLTDGEPVLNERAPGDRPQGKPFTTFMVYWLEGHGHVFRSYTDDPDMGFVQNIEDDAYITCRVVAYGKNAMKRCNILRMALNSDLAQVQTFRNDIGVCDIDDVQSIPEPDVDGAVRERAYFNFKFYARLGFQYDVDWFDRFTLALSVPELGYATTDLIVKES